jgi:hypothetical protein
MKQFGYQYQLQQIFSSFIEHLSDYLFLKPLKISKSILYLKVLIYIKIFFQVRLDFSTHHPFNDSPENKTEKSRQNSKDSCEAQKGGKIVKISNYGSFIAS